jgi:general secretion pathway protein G
LIKIAGFSTAGRQQGSPSGQHWVAVLEKKMNKVSNGKRTGFSLMELLAVVTILGIIAAIIVPRVTVSSDTAKAKVNAHNKATINAAVERYYIETGAWPADNLSDIGADTDYFPDGVPTNPVSGTPYTLNSTTHRVN